MTGCEFCDVLAGRAEGPPRTIDDDDCAAVIGRFQPTGPGYSLVVPKVHVVDLHAVTDEQLLAVMRGVRRVSLAIIEAFGVSGTTILQNNGSPGQSVFHLHFHVVPRWSGDGYPRVDAPEVTAEEMLRQAEVLRRVLDRG